MTSGAGLSEAVRHGGGRHTKNLQGEIKKKKEEKEGKKEKEKRGERKEGRKWKEKEGRAREKDVLGLWV